MAIPGILAKLGLLTTTEAAALVGVHRNTLWNAIREGRLKSVQMGNTCALDRGDVVAFRNRYILGSLKTKDDMATPHLVKKLGLLTAAEVAKLIGVHRASVWNAVKTGHLKDVRIGNTMTFHPSDVSAFREKYLQGTTTTTSVVPGTRGRPPGSKNRHPEQEHEAVSVIQHFLETNFEFREQAACSHGLVWERYLASCRDNGVSPLTERRFSEELERRGFRGTKSGSLGIRHGLNPIDPLTQLRSAAQRPIDHTEAKRSVPQENADNEARIRAWIGTQSFRPFTRSEVIGSALGAPWPDAEFYRLQKSTSEALRNLGCVPSPTGKNRARMWTAPRQMYALVMSNRAVVRPAVAASAPSVVEADEVLGAPPPDKRYVTSAEGAVEDGLLSSIAAYIGVDTNFVSSQLIPRPGHHAPHAAKLRAACGLQAHEQVTAQHVGTVLHSMSMRNLVREGLSVQSSGRKTSNHAVKWRIVRHAPAAKTPPPKTTASTANFLRPHLNEALLGVLKAKSELKVRLDELRTEQKAIEETERTIRSLMV